MFQHIKSRFRDCQKVEESKRYVKVAHRQLRYLRAANAGHTERMVRICFLAMGRLGKRRRELFNAYLKRSLPEDLATSEKESDSSSDAMRRLSAAAWGLSLNSKPQANKKKEESQIVATWGPSWLEKWDLEKVRVLGESQYSHQENTSDWVKENKVRRTIDPRKVVITENCWGLTLKPRQMTHRLQKHWISVLSSLMPPLPQEEWDTLRDIAEGKAPKELWKPPPRRPVAVSTEEDHTATRDVNETAPWDWENYATIPIRKLERKNSRRMKGISGISDENNENPYRDDHPIGVRAFKSRSLKRHIYGRVWQASPVMSLNSKGRWAVKWGGAKKEPMPSKPGFSDLQFFHGVDRKGKIPPQQTSELESL